MWSILNTPYGLCTLRTPLDEKKKERKKKLSKHKPPSATFPAGTSVTHKCSSLFMSLTPTCVYVCSWNPSPLSLKNSLSNKVAEKGILLHFCGSIFSPAMHAGSTLQAEGCQENAWSESSPLPLPFECAHLVFHSLEAQLPAFADATRSEEAAFPKAMCLTSCYQGSCGKKGPMTNMWGVKTSQSLLCLLLSMLMFMDCFGDVFKHGTLPLLFGVL